MVDPGAVDTMLKRRQSRSRAQA